MANNKAHGDLWDPAISANPQRDNGATVLMGGNIDSTPTVTSAPDTAITGAGRKAQPKPVESAYVGTTNANSSGTFAVLAAGHYVAKGGNITTQLAGVAYRGLRGAGNQNQVRGIHTLLTRKTVLIDSWNYATGEPTFNAGNPSSDDFDINSSYQVSTRALPGNVVILDTGRETPTTTALPAKTG
jgi:hypothetical protein